MQKFAGATFRLRRRVENEALVCSLQLFRLVPLERAALQFLGEVQAEREMGGCFSSSVGSRRKAATLAERIEMQNVQYY